MGDAHASPQRGTPVDTADARPAVDGLTRQPPCAGPRYRFADRTGGSRDPADARWRCLFTRRIHLLAASVSATDTIGKIDSSVKVRGPLVTRTALGRAH